MNKRLCQLFQLESNTKDCAVFIRKPEVSPLDLVKLGGFEGHEVMLRISKDPSTICITVFRDGDEPYHMSYGSSTTLVGEARRKVRDLAMEMANLDFGIVTGGRGVRAKSSFERLVEMTSGPRDLNSLREFELIKTPAGDGSLFVNDQHVAHIRERDLEGWLDERGIRMVRSVCEEPSGNGCTIVRGTFELRADGLTKDAEASQETTKSFSEAIDEAVEIFMTKGGWQGLSPEQSVQEFARFMKQNAEPSLDEMMDKAKEKAEAHNADRSSKTKERKSQDKER